MVLPVGTLWMPHVGVEWLRAMLSQLLLAPRCLSLWAQLEFFPSGLVPLVLFFLGQALPNPDCGLVVNQWSAKVSYHAPR